MNTNLQVRWRLVILLLGLALVGCSGNIRLPSTVPVKGIVHYQGKPAPGIRVKFHPQFDMGKIKFVPLGETGADGSFTLSTGAPNNGTPQGDYIVTFEKPVVAPAKTTNYIETEIDAFGGAYSDPSKSGFKVTIPQSGNSLPIFELK